MKGDVSVRIGGRSCAFEKVGSGYGRYLAVRMDRTVRRRGVDVMISQDLQ